jgi:hypothetical protein
MLFTIALVALLVLAVVLLFAYQLDLDPTDCVWLEHDVSPFGAHFSLFLRAVSVHLVRTGTLFIRKFFLALELMKYRT